MTRAKPILTERSPVQLLNAREMNWGRWVSRTQATDRQGRKTIIQHICTCHFSIKQNPSRFLLRDELELLDSEIAAGGSTAYRWKELQRTDFRQSIATSSLSPRSYAGRPGDNLLKPLLFRAYLSGGYRFSASSTAGRAANPKPIAALRLVPVAGIFFAATRTATRWSPA